MCARNALVGAAVAGALALAAATAAFGADPFTPRPPPAPPKPPPIEIQPPELSLDALAANATYIGTINGVTVYVEPTIKCHLYREKGDWRDGACLDLARDRMRNTAQ